MDIDLLKVTITIVLAVLGWLTGHWFTSARARSIKRREFITEYLVNVYRKLDRFAACLISGKGTEESTQDINSAIADIQLFGSVKQIEFAIKIATVMTSSKGVPTQELVELIQHLRCDLRSELGLTPTTKDMVHLNAQFKNSKQNS